MLVEDHQLIVVVALAQVRIMLIVGMKIPPHKMAGLREKIYQKQLDLSPRCNACNMDYTKFDI